MKKRWASLSVSGLTALTLLLAGVDAASAFTPGPGNQFNIRFDQTSPTAIPDVADGTIALGAAIPAKPGVFRVSSFAADGIAFSVTGLVFNTNTMVLAGVTTGSVVSGGDLHVFQLTLATASASWTLVYTDKKAHTKETTGGTYTPSAVPPVSLYDNFSAPVINPAKWSGGEYAVPGGIMTESIRVIQQNALRLASRRYGGTDSDNGADFSGLRLDFIHPESVTAIRAQVQVMSFQATGCASNSGASTYTGMDFGGFFFNTGTPTPGDGTNDVLAVIDVFRTSDSTDAKKVLQIVGNVLLCTSQDCTSTTPLGGSPVSLGTVNLGVPVRLFIAWDKTNKQFLFQRANDVMVAVPYSVPDGQGPGINQKRFQSFGFVANCTSTPRPQGLMDILVRQVETNAH
ncbi:MAG TPA: hypothetical protein VMH32_23895 [Burkholderiales bacterium]|nr:hypothetical protein [Burkholderiales bacterium]